MKLQKNTLILLITAILLSSLVYIYEIKGNSQENIVQAKNKKIFNFAESDIKSFKIERGQEILEFEKTSDQLLPWQMIKPDHIKAEDAAVSYLITPLIGEKSKEFFTISSQEKINYGLDQPSAKLTITLKNNQTHQLIFGKTNFDQQFIYTLIDPPQTDQLTIYLLPISLKNGVERPLEEWKKQVIKETN